MTLPEIPLATDVQPMNRETIFSPCRQYRYTLWREWDLFNRDYLMVIGLNPSTADETQDDPTIRRCIGFAKTWGFGALCMTNLFAWRDTKPENMKAAKEPVGPMNDIHLSQIAFGASMILAAWGKDGAFMDRQKKITLTGMKCLQKNADGTPKHPLYCRANLIPANWPEALREERELF